MKTSPSVRVRFAPSPTGMMHLGNVRTALMNYLFARKHQGSFILRIEDTDKDRIFDPEAQQIQHDLAWLGIVYDEGPDKPSQLGPFFQSQRTKLYNQKLQELIKSDLVYRCFCSQKDLEKKRQRQIALKLPPRYDRTCLMLPPEKIRSNLENKVPFIWRIKLDQDKSYSINDLARGTITFDMKHFSDFPITRQDGSFTFMFANLVDDILMNISHVLRGEDHLTNTAGQVALYHALGASVPDFWHLPILCNTEGKKLSKRDFGFALQDLKKAGYLPEAIVNYLALVGGGTFENEIMPLNELIAAINFKHMNSGGQVKYDLEKLNWINRKWIAQLELQDLILRTKPFIIDKYPEANTLDSDTLQSLILFIRNEVTTLKDFPLLLQFYFEPPAISSTDILNHFPQVDIPLLTTIIKNNLKQHENAQKFINFLKISARAKTIPIKHLFSLIRFCLTGSKEGPSLVDLINLLGFKEAKKRIENVLF